MSVTIAGHPVDRLAFGTAHLPQPEAWSLTPDLPQGRRLLDAALEAGYRHIDTADTLGPAWAEQIVGDVVGGRDDVLVATKVGMLRPAATRWGVLGHPDYLRQAVFASAPRLRREPIDLVYLHRVDPAYPLADQLGALTDLRQAGLIRHIGLSEPTLAQFHAALAITDLAAVQSLYNVVTTRNRPVAAAAAAAGVPFVAYWALLGHGFAAGQWATLDRLVTAWAATQDATDLAAAGLTELANPGHPGRPAALRHLLAAWIVADLPGASVLIGSRDPGHLRAFRAVLDHPLAPAAAAALRQAVASSPLDATFDPARREVTP